VFEVRARGVWVSLGHICCCARPSNTTQHNTTQTNRQQHPPPKQSHLHPDRYKTSLCSEGPRCARPLCFFAHDASELRCVAPMGAVKSSSPVVGTAPPVPAAAPSSVLAGGSLAAPLPQQTYLSAPQLPMAMQPTRAGSAPKLALLAPAGAPASGALPLPRSESGASQLTHGSPSLVRAVSGTAGGSGSATGIGPEVTQQLLQLLWLQERQQAAIADTLSLLVAQQNLLAPVGGGTTAAADWLVATDFEPNPLLPAGSAWPAAPLEGGEPAPLMHDLLFGSSL
jgi:hypothetical protein